MEERIRWVIRVEVEPDARQSEALAAEAAIGGLTRYATHNKHRNVIRSAEAVGLKDTGLGFDELLAHEIQHKFSPGTAKAICEFLEADLKTRPKDSPVRDIRWEGEQGILYSAEGIQLLAERIISKDVSIFGVGPKRAKFMLGSASEILNPEPDSLA